MTVRTIIFAALACLSLVFSASGGLYALNDNGVTEKVDGEKPASASAGVTAGMRYQFIMWNPGFLKNDAEQMRIEDTDDILIAGSSNHYYPVHVYNPVLSIRMSDRWSFTASFSYSRMAFSHYYYQLSIIRMLTRARIAATKLEGDLLFSYTVNPWLKIYWGPKYQGYLMDIRAREVFWGPVGNGLPLRNHRSMEIHTAGLGAGIALTVPIHGRLYLLTRLSWIGLAGTSVGGKADFGSVYIRSGANGALDLAFVIEKIGLTVTAGGIIQYMTMVYDSKRKKQRDPDLYYGPAVALVYAF
ncbi:MAG: hypothetical protein JW838_10255 [Spirochaetes bacterium]|nr:hypothetical protein [Spirochaetota bacterium]